MGSTVSIPFTGKADCDNVDNILKKKASDLTDADKQSLNEFKEKYEPIKEQLKVNVEKSLSIVGKESKLGVDEIAKTRALLKKTLQSTKAAIAEEQKRKESYHQKAISLKKANHIDECRAELIKEKKSNETIKKVIGRVNLLTERIQDIQEADMCNQFVDTVKQVTTAMTAITKSLEGLEPDKLDERIQELDDFASDLDCRCEDGLDEDLDDYFNELDEELRKEAETVSELPSAPTSEPVAEEQTENKRVAVVSE